jgi:hypothetical protein
MNDYKKPKPSSSGSEKELEKVEKQFEEFDSQVKEMTLDRMNMAPKQDVELQTKISQKELEKNKDIYLKPKRVVSSREKFNEDYRKQYEFDKEYVYFVAENHEVIGETINMWTKPYAGMPAEEWEIPCNKPVWAPRYVAEQIKRKCYHRLVMNESSITSMDGKGQYFGQMVVDTTIQRLDARPVSTKKSIFMGVNAA